MGLNIKFLRHLYIDMQVDQFLLFAVFIFAGVGFFVLLLIIEKLISPGIRPVGIGKERVESAERSFPMSRAVGFQYFFYAFIFVIFEALLVLLLITVPSIRSFPYVFSVGLAISLLYFILLVLYLLKRKEAIIE